MFRDQVVWITGASSGIGEALAIALAAEGARLVLSARRENELERVRESCLQSGAGDVLVVPLDVTDWAAMPGALAAVTDAFGRVDLLVNNAGVSQRSLCVDTEMSVYRQLLEVDVLGQIALTKTVLPLMYRQGSGHIAIMASVSGKIGVAQRTGYSAAKHAVMGFFDALRAEAVHHGVTVTTITPGFIKTRISANALTGDGRPFGVTDSDIEHGMEAGRCAAAILEGMRKGKPEIAVGDGPEMKALWLKRLFPGLVFRKVAAMAAPR